MFLWPRIFEAQIHGNGFECLSAASTASFNKMLSRAKTEKDNSIRLLLPEMAIELSAAGMQGYRPEMEDMHVIVEAPGAENHAVVGVFDGHGGSGSSRFAGKSIIKVLSRSPKWIKYVADGCQSTPDLGEALKETFIEIDLALRTQQELSTTRRPFVADESGSTACVCIITPTVIVCANAGDSRCILAVDGYTKQLSIDHKPTTPAEKERIEAAGGQVHRGRIDGELGVSRAFGDFSFKDRDKDKEHALQRVTVVPDIIVHKRSSVDEYMIIACDGLWDVVTSSEAVATLREMLLNDGDCTLQTLTERMLDFALTRGSMDNISCAMVKFYKREKEKEFEIFRLRSEEDKSLKEEASAARKLRLKSRKAQRDAEKETEQTSRDAADAYRYLAHMAYR